MAIAGRTLYEAWSNAKGTGYGQDRLAGMFVTAVNMMVNDLSLDSDLATAISPITSIDDDIDMDAIHFQTAYAGVEYFGMIVGVRPADPKIARVAGDMAEKLWERLKGQYSRKQDNDDQPSQTDTMENIGFLDV